MRSVQVYIEGKRLELFQDEQISVNSSVQNIADLLDRDWETNLNSS